MEGYKRTIVGTILHVLGFLYFAIYPVAILILFFAMDDLPKVLATFGWTTYVTFAIMIFLATVLGYGLFRPLQGWVRKTAGWTLLVAAVLSGAEIIIEAITYEVYSPSMITNVVYTALIGSGFLLGYDSKAAKWLLPFRKEDGNNNGFGSSA